MPTPNYDLLPDGSRFAFWNDETKYAKTYHVAQNHPKAADTNAGTAEAPFKTISRAAELLQPGEQVLIHAGTYRETVRPARGGTSREKMISYEAAPGEHPIISAAEPVAGPFEPSEGWALYPQDVTSLTHTTFTPTPRRAGPDNSSAKIFAAHLPPSAMPGYNPFGMINAPSTPWGGDHFYKGLQPWTPHDEYLMRRGQFFVDGKPLTQARFPRSAEGLKPGTFWVEDSGLIVHFRLENDADPAGHSFEFSAREQCFSPAIPYLAYIHVKGLAFEKAGNGLPPPQRGALSAFCGNHWIIEDCAVRHANTLGIDIGQQAPQRTSNQAQGHHIVRNNIVTDSGICGLAGVGAAITPAAQIIDPHGYPIEISRCLIEHNRFERNGWRNLEGLFESGSIKIHSMHSCLVRHNVIIDHIHGPGIWADWQNVNSRICANAIIDTQFAIAGAIFIEASKHPNLVDNNVIWNVGVCPSVGGDPVMGGHGIYEHDCDHLTARHNFIYGAARAAFCFNRGDINRTVYSRGSVGRKNAILSNIISHCGYAIILPNSDNTSDANCFGAFSQPPILRLQDPVEKLSLPAWQEFHNLDLRGKQVTVSASLDRPTLTLTLTIDGKTSTLNLGEVFTIEGICS